MAEQVQAAGEAGGDVFEQAFSEIHGNTGAEAGSSQPDGGAETGDGGASGGEGKSPEGSDGSDAGKGGDSVPQTTADGGEKHDSDDIERRRTNFANAQRRLEEKRRRRESGAVSERARQLREAERQVREKGGDGSQAVADGISERAADLEASNADAEVADYFEHAREILGDDEQARKYVQDSLRYGDHINKNEPELQKYIDRPEGVFILRAWMRRMDDPELRRQWLGATSLEKQRVLDLAYTRVCDALYGQQPQQQQPQQQQRAAVANDVPAPSAGNHTSTGEFVSEDLWEQALHEVNRMRGRKG